MTLKTIVVSLSLLCSAVFAAPVEITRYENESSSAELLAVQVDGQPAIAVKFTGTDDLHFYADPDTAPAPGLELKASAHATGIKFFQTLYPSPKPFYDATLGKNIDVYVGNFYLVLPLGTTPPGGSIDVSVQLTGIACTSKLCLPPFEKTLTAAFDFSNTAAWPTLTEFTPAVQSAAEPSPSPMTAAPVTATTAGPHEIAVMLLLALVAGLAFNIMPCVLPVLPLIATRMVNIAKEHPARRIALGLAFCAGIVAFFILVGIFSSALRLTTGVVFNLSDPYRYPAFDIGMTLFLVVFSLFMFDILPLTLPSSVSGKTANASTFGGSFGMGYLAAVLSIPCSGAILAAVLVWVQAQHWLLGFFAFLLMGVGMALPYAALVLMPSLLSRIPKPGAWMDLFKKAMGFAMLLLATKPLSALPKDRLVDVTFYAVILAFAVWMWGTWVSFSTPPAKKWLIRTVAAMTAILCGLWLLPEKHDMIDWHDYDRTAIQQAVANQQPVLIKFTADWCTNCKVLESRVFRDADVAVMLRHKNILAVKADTTLADFPAAVDLQKVYGIPGTVPMTLLLLPGNPEPVKLTGIYGKTDLLNTLNKLE